jgi:hypothetical protein
MRVEFENGEVGAKVQAPMVDRPQAEPTPPLDLELPRSLLGQLVGAAVGYVIVMGLAFREGTGIGLIFAVFGVVLVGYYGLPAIMARQSGARPDPAPRRGAWGIDTASGYLPGHAAWAQIMTVPLLMLAWAIVVALLK